jgi:hypothetical protein
MGAGTQISVILENEPGELAKLCDVLVQQNVNIQAMSIQNAKNYVMELFHARETTGRRIVVAEHYRGILRETSSYSVIRLIVDQPEVALSALREHDYPMDSSRVLLLTLKNEPGVLGTMARKLSKEQINIDYVYGSAMNGEKEAMFVFHVDDNDWDRALAAFCD